MPIYDINGIPISSGSGDSVLTEHTIVHPNLFDPETYTVGYLNNNGTINTAQAGCITTDFIPVSVGETICYGYIFKFIHNPWFEATGWASYGRSCLYDSNKQFVANSFQTVEHGDGVHAPITVPTGAAYIRVSWATTGLNYFTLPAKAQQAFVQKGTDNPHYYFPNGIERIYIPQTTLGFNYPSRYYGKRWTLFGDSLTDSCGGHSWDESTCPLGGEGWKDTDERVPWTGYFWASEIARTHGMILDNQAKSGSNIYKTTDNYAAVSGVTVLDTWVAALQNGDFEEPELITIGFGANTYQSQIGSPTDEPSNTAQSLYAGAKYFIETLNEACPHARKVYILHPLHEWRDNDGAAREALRSVYDSYNVEYVDMSKHSGITVDMLPDKLHLYSIEANRQYGRFLESYLF
jgi:lysophospholipase L1-like esterase